jgi:hypothetical protein
MFVCKFTVNSNFLIFKLTQKKGLDVFLFYFPMHIPLGLDVIQLF